VVRQSTHCRYGHGRTGTFGLAYLYNRQLNPQLASVEAETLSGQLMEKTGQVLTVGDRIELENAVAEVLEISVRGLPASA
jgi:hypothetical protein